MIDELSDIQPFEKLLEELKFFDSFEVISDIGFLIVEDETEEYLSPGERRILLPHFHITTQTPDKYSVAIKLQDWLTPFGNKAVDCFAESKFADKFESYERFGRLTYETKIKGSADVVARFVTYYMKLFGYASSSDFKVYKNAKLSKGIDEIPIVSKTVPIPQSLRKIVAKIKELGITHEDSVLMTISDNTINTEYPIVLFPCFIGDSFFVDSAWIISRETFERIKSYSYFDYICFSYCRESITEFFSHISKDVESLLKFITDYFLFNNPKVNVDEINVTLDFAWMAVYSDNPDDDWTYTINADGSETPAEQLEKCMKEVYRYRQYSDTFDA